MDSFLVVISLSVQFLIIHRKIMKLQQVMLVHMLGSEFNAFIILYTSIKDRKVSEFVIDKTNIQIRFHY